MSSVLARRGGPRSRGGRSADLVVVGGGAAGLAAARAARRRGRSVVLVHDGPLGGDCTFTGCVPSKALLEAAARGLDWDEAMGAVRRAVATVAAAEDEAVLGSEGVVLVEGRARLAGPGAVEVDGTRLEARGVVLATGSRPAVPPVPGLDRVGFLTNETVWALPTRPARLGILGAGPVGCELAQAFARLGSAVTLVEAAERPLPREEPEASAAAVAALGAAGVALRLGCSARSVEAGAVPGGIVFTLSSGVPVELDALLVAVGRRPDVLGLGLEEAGVAVDERGYVVADRHLQTSRRGVFVAGDAAGSLQLTHAADEMGRIAAANALSTRPWRRFDTSAIPWVTFTDPEIARVGLREDAAGRGARVAWLPMSEVDRAVAAGRTDGFVKLVAGPRRGLENVGGGRLLGATIVAPRAGEMIQELALALRTGMFPARLALAPHAYPTWSVAIQQAAGQFFAEVGGRRARPARAERPGRQGDQATRADGAA